MKTTKFFDNKIDYRAKEAVKEFAHLSKKRRVEFVDNITKTGFDEIHFWSDYKDTNPEYDVEFTFEEYKEKFHAAIAKWSKEYNYLFN
jgi:hypothetical protein